MSILIFLIVLVILILVHEFGHFIVAKKLGVRVDEFGIGFPPRLFGIKKGETLYSINALPFGGFVKIFGEDPSEEATSGPDSARSFIHQPKWVQTVIIVAGVFFNLVLGWFLISLGFMSGLPMPAGSAPAGAVLENVTVTITGVNALSPAGEAGLMAGDAITGITAGDGTEADITIPDIQSFIAAHGNQEIFFHYERGGNEYEALLVPVAGIVEDRPAIGISMDTIGFVKLPFYQAFWEGAKMTALLTKTIVVVFVGLIVDAFQGQADISGLAGPVGIVGLVGDALEFGFVYLLGFVALISINLAVLNLIPFPALDGGRLLFLLIETVKRSPINPKVAQVFHLVGFAILIILMIVITYNDIVRIIH